MFDMFKGKNKKAEIVSPVTGKAVPVSEIEDPVFKEKVMGDGVAVTPATNEIFAPCNGTVVQIAHTFHAICFESEDGMEILLHLGMDTVKLNGEGFQCHVEVGQKVKKGDKIMDMDIKLIQEKGYSINSPCIILNMDAAKEFEIVTGDVVHGETTIITYKK